ncbi:MAG TPA: endonuclease/exonuclease/phosphatase family protein [Pyrinomonadaceae bacterium]|nr:endonuclease/exonuclease/phosphatase family protein [Pyrinomonadaceae bacterium]
MGHYIRALIIAFCAVTSAGINETQAQPAAKPLRVMSFNIRYDEPRDKENAWPNRKELVASMIRFHRADLVGVQEALKHQLEDLEKLLPGYDWVGVGRDDGKEAGEFSAILYRKYRLTVIENVTFWLSETPSVPGSKGWDAAFPRIVTRAKFKDKTSGKSFFHFNTHFDHRGVRAREESARLLLERIDSIAGSTPVIVTGDFNFNEASTGYKILVAKDSLRDARYASQYGHHGPTSTFNEFKALVPEWRIDYVMVKGSIKVLQHGALADTWDGRFPSDHLPVLAEVLID